LAWGRAAALQSWPWRDLAVVEELPLREEPVLGLRARARARQERELQEPGPPVA
jgi:hypothetical protein